MDIPELIITESRIETAIFLVRGHKVLIDSDLAALYGVETRSLVQAVKRNIQRFPPDFMFQLNKEGFNVLRSQIVISKGKGVNIHQRYNEDDFNNRYTCFSQQPITKNASVYCFSLVEDPAFYAGNPVFFILNQDFGD
jgi:hypothetical protein